MKPAFFSDSYIRTAFAFTIGLFVIAFALAFSVVHKEGVLIMHFTKRGNLDFFGSPGDLLGIVGAGLVAAGVNGTLAYFFYDRVRFFGRLLFFFNVLLGALILISVGVIITAN